VQNRAEFCLVLVQEMSTRKTRSSAVAVIADCIAYVVLANYQAGFSYKFMNSWCTRSDWVENKWWYGVVMNAPKISTQAWPLSMTDQSSVVR